MSVKNYTPETLDIYARSTSMFERKDGHWDYLPNENSSNKRLQYLSHWESVLSKKEGKEWLERFLEIEKIDASTLDKMLAEVQVNEQTDIPEWVTILEKIVVLYDQENVEIEAPLDFLDTETPIPFEEILLPVISLYRQLMDEKLRSYKQVVQASVRTNFERSFLRLISRTMGKVLYEQFYYFRQLYMLTNNQRQVEEKSRKIYLEFVCSMQTGGFVKVLKNYPVLARIISVLTMQLSNVNARFINRFVADYSELKQHFFAEESIGKLSSIGTSVSDRHKGGDGVVILTFDNEEKLVYKPKNLDLAENYDKLIGWINHEGYPHDFKRIKTLNRPEYGWMKFFQFKPCNTLKEVQEYYLRAGSLLCLTHFLQTTDCHYENLIACGKYPMLIDFETILHPHVLPTFNKNRTPEEIAIMHKSMKSLSRTGFLPAKISMQNIDFNMGGFGSLTDLKPVASLNCLQPNSDEMNIANVLYPPAQEIHIPHLGNKPQRLQQHLAPLKRGFEEMYTFLLNHQKMLKGAQSPLRIFKNLPERFLFRNTYVYANILRKLQNPKYLKDGITYSIQLEMLSKAFLKPAQKPIFWEMVNEERRAMMEQDIPFYQTTTATSSLKIQGDYVVTNYFEQPSYQSMLDMLEGLNQEDLEAHLEVIDKSIETALEPKKEAAALEQSEEQQKTIAT